MPDIFENGEVREIDYTELQAKLRGFITTKSHWMLSAFMSDEKALELVSELTYPKNLDDRQHIVIAKFQAGAVKESQIDDPEAPLKIMPPVVCVALSKEFIKAGALIRKVKAHGMDISTSVESGQPMILVFSNNQKVAEKNAHLLSRILDFITNVDASEIQTRQVSREVMDQEEEGEIIPQKESLALIRSLIESNDYWTFAQMACDSNTTESLRTITASMPGNPEAQSCTLAGINLRLTFVKKTSVPRELFFQKLLLTVHNPKEADVVDRQGYIFVMGDERHPPEDVTRAVEIMRSMVHVLGVEPVELPKDKPKPPGFNNAENN